MKWQRLPLLALGLLALLAGLWGGLGRLGLEGVAAQALAWHGPLLISGLFGTLIALERAVAVGRLWAYAAPLLGGLGSLLLLAGWSAAGLALWSLCALGLLISTAWAAARQPEPFMAVLLLGALCALLANWVWWAGASVVQGLPLALSFLVLTIAGERLELSRMLPRSAAVQQQLGAILLALPLSLGLGPELAPRAFGLVLVLLAHWLLCHDLARRTLRMSGLTRFIAVALIAGYVQLLVAGLLLLAFGLQPGTAGYDAALHCLLLGFVFSMVFGHAPLIAPALLRVQLRFHALLYLPLALLHAGLLLRLGGLGLGEFALRRAGAWVSALAILAFIACLLALASARAPTSAIRHAPSH